MKLSFLIPTYNRAENVKNQISFIDSLPSIPETEIEIIIGDNSDNLDTCNYVQSSNLKNVIYFKNDVNIGYGRNVIKCFEYSSGDFIWLLGDKNFFSSESYLNIANLLKRNYDAILIAKGIGNNNDVVYENIDELVAEFGFRFSNLNCAILNKKCLSTIAKCYKYSELNFTHVAVILEFLSSLEKINVLWYKNNIFKLRNLHMSYWNNNVFQVFAHDWFYTIMGLPNKISVTSKIECLKGLNTKDHIFSPYSIIRTRLFTSRQFSLKDLKENREYLELTSFSSYWKIFWAVVLPLPSGLLKPIIKYKWNHNKKITNNNML